MRRQRDTPARRPLGRRPLRRRPKLLDTEPALFAPGGSGSGLVLARGGRDGRGSPAVGSAAPASTDESADLAAADDAGSTVDAATVRIARSIAARLVIPRPPREASARRGAGELVSVRYRGGSDELDLDATVAVLAEHPVPDESDLVVRERVRTRRSIVLAVDASGSMRGERIRTAAAAVGALVGELGRDDVAVLAFWSDAALLVPLGERVPVSVVLERLARVPARGLTNVAFPLVVAARELARIPARDARVLLLSDCVHNAGPDPRDIAARLPRLDVLLDPTAEHDAELGRDLARLGRGRLVLTRRHQDVAPGLSRIFAS